MLDVVLDGRPVAALVVELSSTSDILTLLESRSCEGGG